MLADTEWRQTRASLGEAVAAGDAAKALHAVRELLAHAKTSDLAFCATALKKLSGALVAQGHKLLRTFVVRSVTVEPVLPALQVEAALNGYFLELQVGGYGSYMEELLDPEGAIGRARPDLVCILLDTEEIAGSLPVLCAGGDGEAVAAEVEAAAARVAHMVQVFRANNSARIVLQGCVLPGGTSLGAAGEANSPHGLVNSLREVNRRLAETCGSVPDCVFFDVDQVAAQYGQDRWRDERMFLATRLPLSPGAFRPFAHGLIRSASAMFRPARKVLCTDLDNTLWGGVLGEDGTAGIATGSVFPGNCYLAYQRYLKDLSARGILLAVTSKNNEPDVAEAFTLRAPDLALTLEDFVARKISWNEKVDAIRELATELSLGLDAFVFVDDNPTECEAVRQHLPDVAVVQVPVSEPWRLVGMLAEQWYFDAISVTADDRNRSKEYKAQTQRAALSQNATSREDFLSSLGIVCTFLGAAEAPLDRSVQLLSKTNQFNLTTRRYGANEVMAFVADPTCQAVAVRVRDRFGDAGVVGLALTRQRGDQCWIDTLLLSCRVIGRGIETAILSRLADHAVTSGARWLIGEYLETKKNVPCKNFYPEHGFEPFEQHEAAGSEASIAYRLDLTKRLPTSPSWLTLEGIKNYELANSAVVPA